MFRTTVVSLFACMALALATVAVPVAEKVVYTPPGTLTFVGDAGSPNVFTFTNWGFTQLELPDGDFSRIQATLEFDVSSLRCDWSELQESIKTKKDYFHLKRYPSARVVINGARPLGDGRYQTEALLSLKRVTAPVVLTFTASAQPPYRIVGEGVVWRRQFGFTGNGPKDEVPLTFDLTLPTD